MDTFWNWVTEAGDYGTAVMVPVFEGKALILRRGPTAPWRPGFWNLPGGGIDEGESALQAALRECEEESGLSVTNVRFIGSWNMNGEPIQAFTGEAMDTQVYIRPNHGIIEHDQYQWIGVEDLRKFQFAEPQIIEVIKRALTMRV